jgi:ATP-dependent DNA helicase PIF1
MVGKRMLGMIDLRLRQAFPEHKDITFGGRSVILFGDFGQLPPVLDLPMYVNISRDQLSNDGLAAYKMFREVYKLNAVQRQSGDTNEQQEFRDILLRLRNGESILEDWEKLSVRVDQKLIITEINRFQNATFILTKWSEVNAINTEKLRHSNVPVAKIKAVYTGGTEAKRADSDMAHGLETQLLLARGSRIMLTSNIWTGRGLVNGAMGTVQDLVFEEGQGPPSLPVAVMVFFDDYKGPTINSLEGIKVVPIVPIRRNWEGKNGSLCSRLQVPVRLAWAITVHKSQGLTLQQAVIDLGKKEFAAGLSFVAVSRVRMLENIIFKPFSFERLQHIRNCKRMQERKEEEERLVSMIGNRQMTQHGYHD